MITDARNWFLTHARIAPDSEDPLKPGQKPLVYFTTVEQDLKSGVYPSTLAPSDMVTPFEANIGLLRVSRVM